MEPDQTFKKINHQDVGLLSVSTYVKRDGAYTFVMKYNNKVYETACGCDDGGFGPGVFIKLLKKYFSSKRTNVVFLKNIPFYSVNDKKHTVMIKMNFKHSEKIVTTKLYLLHTYDVNRIAYESDTIYHDDKETVTYRKQTLRCTYYIYTFTKHSENKSKKINKNPKLLAQSTIDMNEYEPWNHKPNGYIMSPCITECDLKFSETDYIDGWNMYESIH